jgi:ERCC4-type nuclease
MEDTLNQKPITIFFSPGERSLEKPVIYADSREASSSTGKEIVKKLMELGADVKLVKLEFGDYLVGGDVAIERKTIVDFVGTLTRRFLFNQIFEMRRVYPRSLMVLEGYMGVLRKFSRISPESVSGALFALAQNGVPIIPTIDHKDTAVFLYTAARQEQIVEKRMPMVRPAKKVETLAEAQRFLMCGLPLIGREKANSILIKYGSPVNAFTHVDEWDKVEGIGNIIKKKAKDVLTTPFQPTPVENPKFYAETLEKIKLEQKELSRKKKGSKNT